MPIQVASHSGFLPPAGRRSRSNARCPTSNPQQASRDLSNLLTNLNCGFETRSDSLVIAPAAMQPQGEFRFTRGSDGAAYLGSNGTIQQMVRFAAPGEYQFVLRVSGSEAGGVLPQVRIGLDGRPIADLLLEQSDWHTLRITTPVTQGEHQISLAFTNDYDDPPADRNLRIQALTIRPLSLPTNPAP